jgi:16S rRNA (guanine(966)-N(2))-methyltransferase RsmD
LFNLLNNRMSFEGIDVLDLFAGTGGIGLECISRGAREVTAVEIAHVQQNWIISCCKQLGIRNLSVIRGDVFKFLSACRTKYDFIFADPPYALEELPALPDLILKQEILKEDGWLVIEHGKDTDFTSHPQHVETRSYGSVHFSFFQSI